MPKKVIGVLWKCPDCKQETRQPRLVQGVYHPCPKRATGRKLVALAREETES